jgi:TonB family protein
MRTLLTAATLLCLAPTSATAQPREVRRLKSTSQWQVDYADESCQLARTFGEGKQKVVLILYQLAPGDWFKLTLVGSSLKPAKFGSPKARMQFGPTEAKSEITVLEGESGPDRLLIIEGTERLAPLSDDEKKAQASAWKDGTNYRVLPISADREKAVTWLALENIMKFDMVLETGPMDAPMTIMRDCTWNLVESWGLNVAQQKALKRMPYPKNVNAWFDADDYPKSMVASNKQGIVNFRLLIDPTGKPESCHIQVSTRPKEFDDVVCRGMMKRAKFHPALDAEGKPVRSYYQNTIRFYLEG